MAFNFGVANIGISDHNILNNDAINVHRLNFLNGGYILSNFDSGDVQN